MSNVLSHLCLQAPSCRKTRCPHPGSVPYGMPGSSAAYCQLLYEDIRRVYQCCCRSVSRMHLTLTHVKT